MRLLIQDILFHLEVIQLQFDLIVKFFGSFELCVVVQINNITQMSKIRKVYNLRKTSNIRGNAPPEQSRVSQAQPEQQQLNRVNQQFQKNTSMISQNAKQTSNKAQEQPQDKYQVEGEELVIDRLQLNFNIRLNDIERKQIKIKNIGNSAIYIQFVLKNSPKINACGFKDTKLKFYCHYENNVIKPGEEVVFFFAFQSQFPGHFTQQVQIKCQPSLKTMIPNLKLSGRAFISDEWESARHNFEEQISDRILRQQVRQILSDIVNKVKLPPPPKPDVKNQQIAQKQFQKNNKHLNLYFNAYLHNWFNELFIQISKKIKIAEEDIYWDQSVQTIKSLIINSELDQVDKKCYSDRLQHYCYLSMTPLPNKSELYQTIYEFVSTASYHLGGEYIDAARKQLDMWEIPFREPLETDTPQQLKVRKEEVEKIKAEWIKKAKKKKWGEEEEKEMINQFKKKVQTKTTENILNRFNNFEESAEFVKARQFLKKSDFNLSDYQHFLERMKTVKQYSLQGKKVLLKWNLKLKQNCQQKLKELEQYLTKKKQEEKRLQEEKKNQGGKKKKTAPKPKKKGAKEQQQQKPLFFDFMSILDEENWNGLTESFRIIMEKQPFLVLIGITYGPRTGRTLQQYSVHFLLQHLKTLESSIQFLPHNQLDLLAEKLQSQTIGEGSILLLQNLNFLPWEVTQEENLVQAQEGHPPTIIKRKLLQPQIRNYFDKLGQSIDILVNQDRFLHQLSGFSAYLNRQVILGSQWWKYIGLSMRVIQSSVIFGQNFTPDNYILIHQLSKAAKQIFLVGQIGVKFYIAKNKLQSLGNVHLTKSQKDAINTILEQLQAREKSQILVLPTDFILHKNEGDELVYKGGLVDTHQYQVKDIGEDTISKINQINQGDLFIMGQTSIDRKIDSFSQSLAKILKTLYKKQQLKRQRHSLQASTPIGINYDQDLVIYLIGINQNVLEKVQLRDKKIKIIQQDGEQNQEQEQQEAESDKKKIDMISDFHLSSKQCLYRLWNGKFNIGLKDISKYSIIYDD